MQFSCLPGVSIPRANPQRPYQRTHRHQANELRRLWREAPHRFLSSDPARFKRRSAAPTAPLSSDFPRSFALLQLRAQAPKWRGASACPVHAGAGPSTVCLAHTRDKFFLARNPVLQQNRLLQTAPHRDRADDRKGADAIGLIQEECTSCQ
jgi:hypothetical protein